MGSTCNADRNAPGRVIHCIGGTLASHRFHTSALGPARFGDCPWMSLLGMREVETSCGLERKQFKGFDQWKKTAGIL